MISDCLPLTGRKVLIVVTEDWYFWSHRLALARSLRDGGFHVVVATRVQSHGERIRSEGFELHDVPMLRRGLPGAFEVGTVVALAGLYRRLRPNLVVHVALKPVVLGALAGRLSGAPPTLNILTGMGFVFTSESLKARILRVPISAVMRSLLVHPRALAVVQNSEDFEVFTAAGVLTRPGTRLIKGSGVDANHFLPLPEPSGEFSAAVVCRMLADKGIYDVIEAARILRARRVPIRILLVGPLDPLNPTAISESELQGWKDEGLADWLGPVNDVRDVWRRAHVAVLPSHREGLPKSLIEAASCGRPIVATDTTGCREVVEDGLNGRLIPFRAPDKLAAALEELSRSPAMCRRFGLEGRRRVVEQFSEDVVIAQYRELCFEVMALASSESML